MKLIFSEGEKERIEEINKTTNALFAPSDIGKEIGLKIEITNPAVADVFITTLLHLKQTEELDPGFKILEVQFRPTPSRELLKSKITQAVADIIDA